MSSRPATRPEITPVRPDDEVHALKAYGAKAGMNGRFYVSPAQRRRIARARRRFKRAA